MPSISFNTEGDGKLHDLTEFGRRSITDTGWVEVTVAVPGYNLSGSAVSAGCAVGYDGSLVSWLIAGGSINFKTANLGRVCWQDNGSASFVTVFWNYAYEQAEIVRVPP